MRRKPMTAFEVRADMGATPADGCKDDPQETLDLGAIWEWQELSTQFCRLSSISSICRIGGLLWCLGSVGPTLSYSVVWARPRGLPAFNFSIPIQV